MRIHLRICIGMMHTMHDSIRTRAHVRRALSHIRKDEKESLPKLIHCKGSMRGISMLEKGLKKEGSVPKNDKKQEDEHKNQFCTEGEKSNSKIDFYKGSGYEFPEDRLSFVNVIPIQRVA